MTSSLTAILTSANRLTVSEPSPDLKTTLLNRLCSYYELRGPKPDDLQSSSLSDLQLLTAKEALNLVSDIQQCLSWDPHTENHGSDSDMCGALGTRDLTQLRTLISIVFKWGIDLLMSSCLQAWPTQLGEESRVSSQDEISTQYSTLADLVDRIMGILFPGGPSGPLSNTHVTVVVTTHHLVDLFKPSLALGWLPKSLSTGSIVARDTLRPFALRLLSILAPSQAITTLGGVLASRPTPSLHMRRISTMLLGKQITRTRGVEGLCIAVLGEEDTTGDEAALAKLEQIARVLLIVPQGIQPQNFYGSVVHQILSLLSENTISTHKRAAAFTVSRMLASESSHPHVEVGSRLLLATLHASFIQVEDANTSAGNVTVQFTFGLAPHSAISVLTTLVSNMDPQPASISRLFSPIVHPLYSLLYHLDKVRTSDPTVRDAINGLLVTWGKIVDKAEGLHCLWSIYQGQEIYWDVYSDRNIRRTDKPEQVQCLSFFTPSSLEETKQLGFLDDDANIMDLYPDPAHYVRFLKGLDRPDITSDLFVKFLESYRERRLARDVDSLRTLLTLQIVIQMQKQLSTGPSSSNLLCKPAHLLQFIKDVLESSTGELEKCSTTDSGLKRGIETTLRLSEQTGTEDELGDSDDEAAGLDIVSPGDEMMETAINLLLSIMEANEELSARTMPVLNDIYSLLDPVSRDGPTSIRTVAHEAKMVMTARLASTSAHRKARSSEEDSPTEIYQKALKLLQDPILPVRAHGLLLLRQLVTRSGQDVESALIPAILSIFLQAVQDDESYLFLNAVQGLAAMVDSYGKDLLKALMREYTDGLANMTGGDMSQHGLDIRTRVGEALGIVIRRVGSALGIYSDILIPPLFQVIRSPSAPTTLRTSSLSLLADCVNTYTLAVLPYVVDLTEAMIDLLQVESASPGNKISATIEAQAVEETNSTMDAQPTSTNPKFPPLRRAALHFLSLLIRSMIEHSAERPTDITVPISTVRRAKITLAYVASTDEDNIIRVMAREAGEGLEQLQQVILGI